MDRAPIRLLLVDDHAVVRIGLASLFATVPAFSVVGEAASAAEAIEQARRCRPNVVVMDVRLPDASGIEACRELRAEQPEARVLMLTSYSDHEAVVGAVMAGAAGYVLKRSSPNHLIHAVNVVATGGSVLDPEAAQAVVSQMRADPASQSDDPFSGLPEHQRKLLPLLAEGRTNRAIAAELCLSESTVKTYVSEILRHLGLSHRAQAVALLARRTEASHLSVW
jgi:two-component system response regulator DevR